MAAAATRRSVVQALRSQAGRELTAVAFGRGLPLRSLLRFISSGGAAAGQGKVHAAAGLMALAGNGGPGAGKVNPAPLMALLSASGSGGGLFGGGLGVLVLSGSVSPSRARILQRVRYLSSGGPDAGAGAGKKDPGALVLVSDSGGNGGGGGTGHGDGGLGAGVGGACSGCSNSKELAKLRADMMDGNEKLWSFCTNLLEQNGKLINEFATLRVETKTGIAELGTSVTRLTYNMIFSVISLGFGVFTFIMPYVKENWQSATVKVVLAEIQKLEEKRKTEEAAKIMVRIAAKKIDEAPKNKKWGIFGY